MAARLKHRIVTKAALIRLAVLFLVLGAFTVWCWLTMIRMPLKSYAGPWVPLSPDETGLRDALRRDVRVLAGDIGERNVFVRSLVRDNSERKGLLPSRLQDAARFIESALTNAGYRVEAQGYPVSGETCFNLEVEIRGSSRPEEIVIVGAHYDSVSGSPGANDNGSAVASLLALARWFSQSGNHSARTLRFVAFVNEEPPFFQTDQMGSLVYARRCRERHEKIVAMLGLETMGYYSDAPGSQKYPFPIGLFYPSTGNFIGFVGNTASASLVRQAIASFRRNASFPSQGAALPGWMPGVGWSDHWAFWQAGYPGIMITDTAPFRYPYYHTADDTPDKLDYDRLARVVAGLQKVILEFLNP
jgi:Peptidase family M28